MANVPPIINKTRHARFPLPKGEEDKVSLREFHVLSPKNFGCEIQQLSGQMQP
jgi:hypothetical protein